LGTEGGIVSVCAEGRLPIGLKHGRFLYRVVIAAGLDRKNFGVGDGKRVGGLVAGGTGDDDDRFVAGWVLRLVRNGKGRMNSERLTLNS
jgi:hypothetical protein